MTETKMEVVKLMPKEYTKAEADAFKHGFFLGAKSEREEMIDKFCEWVKKNVTYTHPRKGTEECIINLSKFKEAMMED